MPIAARTKPYLILTSALLVPGLGHFLQKKPWRGAIFFGGILALLVLGLAMEGGFVSLSGAEPLTILTFLGDIGSGFFYAAAKLAGLGAGNLKAYTFQYGSMYIAATGFMNGLVVLNAWRIAKEPRRV